MLPFALAQDLWVPSINCTTTACQSKVRYNEKLSGKSVYYPGKTFSINYVDGSGVSGGVYADLGKSKPCPAFSVLSCFTTNTDNLPSFSHSGSFGGLSCSGNKLSAVTKLETSLNDDPVVRQNNRKRTTLLTYGEAEVFL